jgi:hypothetical protein
MTPKQTSTTDDGTFKRALHRIVVDRRVSARRVLPVGMQDELRLRAERRQADRRHAGHAHDGDGRCLTIGPNGHLRSILGSSR